jgi:hypothetical protein
MNTFNNNSNHKLNTITVISIPFILLIVIIASMYVTRRASAQHTVKEHIPSVVVQQAADLRITLSDNISSSSNHFMIDASNGDHDVTILLEDNSGRIWEFTNGSLVSIFVTEGYWEYEYFFMDGTHVHVVTKDNGVIEELHIVENGEEYHFTF